MAIRVCRACGGKAYIKSGCRNCKGKGGWYEWMPINPETTKRWVQCPDCGGTGNGACPNNCDHGYIRV
jgi:DnaJ-class molecular chaperone